MFYNLKKKSLLTFALTLGLALGTVWHTPAICSAGVTGEGTTESSIIVEQNYNPTSTNAVSGKAMAGIIGDMTKVAGMYTSHRNNLIDIPWAMDMPDDGLIGTPNIPEPKDIISVIYNVDQAIGDQSVFTQMKYISEAPSLAYALCCLDQQLMASDEVIQDNSDKLKVLTTTVNNLGKTSGSTTAAVGDLSKLRSMSNISRGQSGPMLMAVDDNPGQDGGVDNLVDAIGSLDDAIGNQAYYQDMHYVKGATNVVEAVGRLDEQVNVNANAIDDLKNAEEANAKAIADETTRAKNAEEALGKRIDGLEVNSTDLGPVNAKLDKLGDRVEKVGANAAALAALHPMPTDDGDKLSVAVGGGTYRDKYATALGLFYRPSDRVMLSLAGSTGSGESMANVGLSFALDREVKGMPSRKALNAQVKELKAENAVQAEQIKMLIERIEALEAKK